MLRAVPCPSRPWGPASVERGSHAAHTVPAPRADRGQAEPQRCCTGCSFPRCTVSGQRTTDPAATPACLRSWLERGGREVGGWRGQRRSVTPSLTHCRRSTNTLSEQINNDFHLVRRSSAPGTSHILCRHPNDPGKGVSFPFLQMRKVGGQTGYVTFAQTQRAANEAPCR